MLLVPVGYKFQVQQNIHEHEDCKNCNPNHCSPFDPSGPVYFNSRPTASSYHAIKTRTEPTFFSTTTLGSVLW